MLKLEKKSPISQQKIDFFLLNLSPLSIFKLITITIYLLHVLFVLCIIILLLYFHIQFF